MKKYDKPVIEVIDITNEIITASCPEISDSDGPWVPVGCETDEG